MTIATIRSATPERTALWFRTILAVDKGVPSTLTADGDAFIVTADDGKAVRFVRDHRTAAAMLRSFGL